MASVITNSSLRIQVKVYQSTKPPNSIRFESLKIQIFFYIALATYPEFVWLSNCSLCVTPVYSLSSKSVQPFERKKNIPFLQENGSVLKNGLKNSENLSIFLSKILNYILQFSNIIPGLYTTISIQCLFSSIKSII